MPRCSSFEGLVFDPAVVGPLEAVTAPPYDVIGDAAERAYLRASPYNVVRLDLGDRLPDGTASYERAGALLATWRMEGALRAVPEGCFAYEMRPPTADGGSPIRGIVAAMELLPFGGDVVPHERTMPGPIEDRLRQLRATRANLSPVYATVGGRPRVSRLGSSLAEAVEDPPGWRVVDDEDVEHRMWPVRLPGDVAEELAAASVMIADGHHRYATALAYREERRATDGPGPWDRLLVFLVEAGPDGPPVRPYHRLVVRGPVPAGGERVRDLAELLARMDDDGLRYGIVTADDAGVTFRVAELEGPPPTVAALHREVLPESDGDATVADLRFTPNPAAAVEAVRDGRARAGLLLPTTSAERIREVVERGERLPQKSTFFWPKPRTGMVIRPLDAGGG